jgi:hypothetical protein
VALPERVPLLHLPLVPFPGVILDVPASPQIARLFEQTGSENLVFALCADSVMAASQGPKVGGLAELKKTEAGGFKLHVVARGRLREVESLTPVPIVSWDAMPEEEAGELGFLVGPLLQHAGGLLPDELHAFLRLPSVLPDNVINLVASRWPLTRQQQQALLELASAEARAKALLAGPAGAPRVDQTPLRLRWEWKLKTWKGWWLAPQHWWVWSALALALGVALLAALFGRL